jgi:D-serine deaminase-like pyridoxal phosphate-dependent protein
MAGGPKRLWPHVKSHKSAGMICMQMELGITKFKCATIAEAEIAAEAGAERIILAYPLVGPNVSRYLRLAKAYSRSVFYGIGDDIECLSSLAAEACRMETSMNVLIDVDMGMHRTGVPLELLESFYKQSSGLKGINVKGMHCYDGHCNDRDFNRRKTMVEENDRKLLRIRESLVKEGFECEILVMGGTPSFPCRTGKAQFFLSPGTLFINDWGCYSNLPDLAFNPGAAVFCRMVSRCGFKSESENTFTLDLGSKGIATDPVGARGVIAGLEEAKPLFQSEEHWVFSLPSGMDLPPIGSEVYVIPTHICPTSALYPEILVAQRAKITERWQVGARNRKITY